MRHLPGYQNTFIVSSQASMTVKWNPLKFVGDVLFYARLMYEVSDLYTVPGAMYPVSLQQTILVIDNSRTLSNVFLRRPIGASGTECTCRTLQRESQPGTIIFFHITFMMISLTFALLETRIV